MRDKYGVAQDHYCYPDSTTLINLLNIRDSEELVFVAGYELSWPEISKQKWVEANIQGYVGNLSLLESIFDQAIR
ncbi:hypothetical protein BOO29_12305 [Vibrio navarrensis]|nr:hypothetical protein EA25_07360 [Vibrio navarrensis]MBE4585738.1 hypothetical protein [Vibrio navarrensis]